MKFRLITKLAAVAVAGGLVLGGSIAAAATLSSPSAPAYCVKFGSGVGAAGNVVEYNWDGAACPAGTYPHGITDRDVTAPAPSSSGSPSPSPSSSPDTDSFLPVNFNTGHAPNSTSPADTTFTLTDNSTEPAVVYTCHFDTPVFGTPPPGSKSAPLTSGISCTKN